MISVLLVLTSARTWSQKDGRQRPTGFWAEEFVVPHRALLEGGVGVTIATPGGRVPGVDESSMTLAVNGNDPDKVADLRRYLAKVQPVLDAPARLEDADPAAFDAVLIPGGHGPMQDLAVNPDIARILTAMLPDERKVVASLCHGPASFLAAGTADRWLFQGRRLTAFSDAEEQQVGLAENAPWLLEERLRLGGAEYSSGPAWAPYVVVDGNLITGQNPASGESAVTALLKELEARAS